MAKSSNKPKPVYELKHRLTGAAILIFGAVLIIPMLLEEPELQASISDRTDSNSGEEKTFKSKIEPINLETLNISNLSKQEEGIKPALLGSQSATSKTEDKQKKPSIKIEGEESGNGDASATEKVTESEKKKIEPVVLTAETKKDEVKDNLTEQKAKEAEESRVAKSADQSDTSIKNGWTVRVGTFSKPENVELVSKLLDSSGFTARHTEVETTLGKATRVWLGPYEDKETAEKVSTRLRTLTGEKGYVTKQVAS
jgi:DedD protein